MAIKKICGIETEYGIVHRGTTDPNPITASSILINSYLSQLSRSGGSAHGLPTIGWDFEFETPGVDARGVADWDAMPPEVETQMVNAVLTNGARYYVDHAHPELSTPECGDALSVVTFDRSADVIAERSMRAADALLPEGQSIVLYKNNSDGKGNSYGCHENYLLDRNLPFGRIVAEITPHFITRQLFCGAGKVGSELGLTAEEVPYQLTQRADFFEEEVGLETTLKRPIINTRDEPHADPQKYRRLHVIIGDANMSEVATFLKVGTTAIILAMIEDDWIQRDLRFADPLHSLQTVSVDLSLSSLLKLASGQFVTAIDIQRFLIERAIDWSEHHGFESVGVVAGPEILRRWQATVDGLATDPSSLASTVDWIAKLRLIDGYRERHDLSWSDARLRALDLQYHDLRPERSLSQRVGLETICHPEAIERGITQPPDDTRAYFRGACLTKFGDDIVSANWDSLVFDIGVEPLRRVAMMEPSRGTAAHVASVIESSNTSAELLERLGS
ncbi:MAG: depupylase/deamidase Dop [Acidimicrobiales bacterium]